MNRRGLFAFMAAAPIAAVLPVPKHEAMGALVSSLELNLGTFDEAMLGAGRLASESFELRQRRMRGGPIAPSDHSFSPPDGLELFVSDYWGA